MKTVTETSFTDSLVQNLSSKHLLKHPFYQKWSDGSLAVSTLQTYASQYFKHVSAFPRYLSATHSHCEDIATRQILLDNLIDEERGSENHPELWLRFAEGLGVDRETVQSADALAQTQKLVDGYLDLAKSSFEEGLGALFAYEHQIPEIAKFKMEALRNHYCISQENNPSAVQFFEVHQKADVYHSQAISSVMEKLSPAAKEKVENAARLGASYLWNFLDGIELHTQASKA